MKTWPLTVLMGATLLLPAYAQEKGSREDARPERSIDSKQQGKVLRQRHRMRQAIKKKFDKNGDGKLDAGEREALRKAMVGRKVGAERLRDRIDRDDDGKIERNELRRAKRVHDRVDRNDDGKVGRKELRRAKRVHDRVDRNDDGKVGRKELRRAKTVRKRVDANKDGKVQRKEAVRARRVQRRRKG